jgi:hypothetical protein
MVAGVSNFRGSGWGRLHRYPGIAKEAKGGVRGDEMEGGWDHGGTR